MLTWRFAFHCCFSVVLLSRLASAHNHTETTCAVNEVYLKCGSDCKQYCKNLNDEVCLAVCREGCFCIEGYARNVDGRCIRVKECPAASCPDNQVPSVCVSTCNDCIQRGRCYPKRCISGCDCKEGYFRDRNGTCIPEEFCPPGAPCGENEAFQECGSECRQSCKTLNQKVCTEVCRKGCFCIPPYVRNEDGRCIFAHECPKESCPDHQRPSSCFIPCNDCTTRGRCHYRSCYPGCDCEVGYYRDHKGNCIPANSCPPVRCTRNETVSECVKPCNECRFVKEVCPLTAVCQVGCDCRPGFARNRKGQCVRIRDCDTL